MYRYFKIDMIKLSICIPTYNFGEFISETLDSILAQISEEVEVIILDGGSTDNTSDIVKTKQLNYSQLYYYYQNFRGGIDRDIEKVVSLAKGKYCWLFSADDIMLPGSIIKVIKAIKSNYDIYLCEHFLCTLDMEPIRKYPPFNKINHPTLFDLSDTVQKKEYFYSARTSEAFFSFLSGPIFKKEIWDSVEVPKSFYGTCWIVAGHLLSLIPKGLMVSYLSDVLLHKRGENDSFTDRGTVYRYKIAIENFQHIANEVFGEHTEEAFHIRRVLQQDISLLALILAKLKASKNPEKENINVLNRIVKMHYSNVGFENRIKYALYKISPVSILSIAYTIKKGLLGRQK